MAKTLIILESPTKSKTFEKVLGKKDFRILASKGHVIDLPKSKLGIDLEKNFEPQFVTIRGKAKVLKELKEAAKSVDRVLLATDPDREGEAIAWHLYQQLLPVQPEVHRILLNEITKEAIQKAVQNPVAVDRNKVEAQQARRVLDRLVGYQISPVLWKVFYYGLSAGRVQSVALRLIVEREREREAFIPVEYWSLEADLKAPSGEILESKLNQWEGKKAEISDEASMKEILDHLEGKSYQISKVEKKERKRSPEPPHITSTLQREASSRLSYNAKRTMVIAQQLYEGIEIGDEGAEGLITYMRTDSVRVSDSAREEHRQYVQQHFGKDYLPSKDRHFKSKKSAQDAHEAIRPTSAERSPESLKSRLSKEQLAVYTLIWNRFMASLMSDARFEATRVDIEAGKALFRVTGNRLVFDGFRRVSTGKDQEKLLPEMKEGDLLDLEKLHPKQHFTEPSPRYSEASLIKELEEKGIGRPSTYATIVSTIQSRDYLALDDNRRFFPTELGSSVWTFLDRGFPTLFEVGFTASMEEELDKVEVGEEPWTEVVEHLYTPLKNSIEGVEERIEEIRADLREMTEIECEKCQSPMLKTWGRNGRFLACSKWPDCKFSRPI
ncbi:MAG: type I DNA topoisomerase, partial [Candidatus Krumholzibacteria bacterium]|nr:type I DNA topoisomerase [Candidatus Krumholzibacteria bacterium]